MVIPDTAELGKVWALMDLVVARGTEYFGGRKAAAACTLMGWGRARVTTAHLQHQDLLLTSLSSVPLEGRVHPNRRIDKMGYRGEADAVATSDRTAVGCGQSQT